jgi:predicted amidohydrolase
MKKLSISLLMLVICHLSVAPAIAKSIRIGVVQATIENTLDKNLDKILTFIEKANQEECDLILLPESLLYYSMQSIDHPSIDRIDQAIEVVRQKAISESIYIVLCTQYKDPGEKAYYNRVFVFDPDGRKLIDYRKYLFVPPRFYVNDIPMNIVLCADRWQLEYSDLPPLVQDSKVILDTSGGHGGDDGRPDLRWIRYQPMAQRTNSYIIVSSVIHHEVDFMGNSPYGGCSAVIRPDGTLQAKFLHEVDTMLVVDIDLDLVVRKQALTRRNHPLFKSFWDAGEKLINREQIMSVPELNPYISEQVEISVAAVQMTCSRNIDENVTRITKFIGEAAENKADIVVFPELSITGPLEKDILAADQRKLDQTVNDLQESAKNNKIHVIVGAPYFFDNNRKNCAIVISDSGIIKTIYAQVNGSQPELFSNGTSTKALWFRLKGVYSIVTIGDDAEMIEIPDLASHRGMNLHFHISNERYASEEGSLIYKQKNITMLQYANFGAFVNASGSYALPDPGYSAGGNSMIVSREGGHNIPAPEDIEYYLPYATSIVESAGSDEVVLYARRKIENNYPGNLIHSWRFTHRKNREQAGWDDWMNLGGQLIDTEHAVTH